MPQCSSRGEKNTRELAGCLSRNVERISCARPKPPFWETPGTNRFSERPRSSRFSPFHAERMFPTDRVHRRVSLLLPFSLRRPFHRPIFCTSSLVLNLRSLLTDLWPRKQPRQSKRETRASKTSRVIHHDDGSSSILKRDTSVRPLLREKKFVGFIFTFLRLNKEKGCY